MIMIIIWLCVDMWMAPYNESTQPIYMKYENKLFCYEWNYV